MPDNPTTIWRLNHMEERGKAFDAELIRLDRAFGELKGEVGSMGRDIKRTELRIVESDHKLDDLLALQRGARAWGPIISWIVAIVCAVIGTWATLRGLK